MALTIGTQLGSYEITALLGKGGMGEVYRALDAKLRREVAIKFLPEEFSRDGNRTSRFQREAEVLASLNHSNIAAIYDLQEANGSRFLVLELVEGETLAERISRGPIPLEEALDIAKQICDGLEAAHERGIVHRDLKPANVKISPDGKIKILDFGLAKAVESAPTSATVSNSPTMLSGTLSGMILGTAAYMSPEQAKGKPADKRSDIWAFGVVLYEMLTGEQLFRGETVSETLAAVLRQEVDWKPIPAKVERLLRQCLERDSRLRLRDIGDYRLLLEPPDSLKFPGDHGTTLRPLWKRAIPVVVTAIVAGTIAGVAVWKLRPSQPVHPARFSFVLPEGQHFTSRGSSAIAISPDGANVVYNANDQLYLRPIGDMEARPIQGTAAKTPYAPFFSPDGNWVGFYARADRKFEKVPITGGSAVPICDAENLPWSASWSSTGDVFMGSSRGIERVSANGGTPETVIKANAGELLLGPQLLPGGDALLFTVSSASFPGLARDKAQIVVQSLKTGKRTVLIDDGSDGRYLPTGHLVYSLGSALFAVRFDVKNLQVIGSRASILEGVSRATVNGASDFSFSNYGSMVYIPGEPGKPEQRTIVRVDRDGVRKPLNLPPANYSYPRISPNGDQLVVDSFDGKDRFVAVYDLTSTALLRRLTFGRRNDRPLWSHDGKHIVFASNRDGQPALFWQSPDGQGTVESLVKVDVETWPEPESWTPDGKILILTIRALRSGNPQGLATWSIGDQKLTTLVQMTAHNANLSPDGRWLAYRSRGESDSFQVYVEPFPPTGMKYQVTMYGGTEPLWSPDGKQLYYASTPSGQLMSVDILKTQPALILGKTTPLPIKVIVISGAGPRLYDIMPDGKSFVVLEPQVQIEPAKTPPEQINITLNWFTELQERVPVK